jgi:hypothetical protein
MNEEKSACIKKYAVFPERVKAFQLISMLDDCINFYAAAKWWGYKVRMGITQAGEVKKEWPRLDMVTAEISKKVSCGRL